MALQKVPVSVLPFHAAFWPYGAYLGFGGSFFFIFFQGWTSFAPWRTSTFLMNYLVIFLLAAELDAGTPYGPEDIQRAATPSSTTSSSTSSEDSEKSTDTPTEIEASLPDGVVLSPVFFVQDSRSPSNIRHSTTPSSTTSSRTSSEDSEESTVTPTVIETSLQDDVVPSPGLSVPTSRPLPQPLQIKQSVYRYRTMLYEYATSAKKPEPIYKKEWVSINLWRCVAVFDSTLGVGEAQSFREAKHIASQKICQTLNIID